MWLEDCGWTSSTFHLQDLAVCSGILNTFHPEKILKKWYETYISGSGVFHSFLNQLWRRRTDPSYSGEIHRKESYLRSHKTFSGPCSHPGKWTSQCQGVDTNSVSYLLSKIANHYIEKLQKKLLPRDIKTISFVAPLTPYFHCGYWRQNESAILQRKD